MKNFKKVIAILLAVMMLASSAVLFTSCSDVTEENPGAVIELYMPYTVNLDPATAYADDASAKLLSLMYEGLTTISSNGKLEEALADSWETYTDRDGSKILEIKLKTTRWSDGTVVNATHFIDAWERILDPAFNCQAASLLFPIKNASEVKRGNGTLSDLGIESANQSTLTITLEDWADPDTFLRNCASVALCPIRKDVINKIYDKENGKENDWSSLIAIMVSNGPFYLKNVSFGGVGETITRPYMILERNTNYYRDPEKNQALDKYVTPYRLKINMTYGYDEFQDTVDKQLSDAKYVEDVMEDIQETMTEEELANITTEQLKAMAEAQITQKLLDSNMINGTYVEKLLASIRENKSDYYTYFNEGSVQYNSSLPLTEDVGTVTSKNSMMTGSFLFNTTNEILDDARVRKALSLALDREAIANLVKYGEAASTLVSSGVFDTTRKTSFKDKADYGISTGADVAAAKALLKEAGVSGGSFNISVRADELDIMVAQYAAQAWKALGFKVGVRVYGYDVVTYTEKTLTEKKDEKGNLVYDANGNTIPTWADEVIYDGLLHDNFMDAYKASDFDVMFFDINMLTTDAFPVLAQFASIYSGSVYDFSDPANFDITVPHITGYVNSEYDTLLSQAMVETDAAKRAELLHSAEKLLLDDMPITPLFYYTNSFLLSDEIDDVELDYFGASIFTDASYDNYVPVVEGEETTEGAPSEETPAE